LIRILALISIFIGVSHQFELNCVFQQTGWDDILIGGKAFACKVKNLNITLPQQLITKVLPERNDNVVNALLILEQNCEFFPHGIVKYFGNLEGIAVQKSNLKKITKSDLKGFWNLRSISLFGNKLRVIENELFRYNPKLELVSLFKNELQHIFPSAFDNLVNIKILYLNSNPCINQDALEPSKIEKLKCEMVVKCAVTEGMREFAGVESEKLKIEEENIKLKGSFDAVSKNLAANKKKLERTREGYEK
jgi:Leucine rich repeat